MSAKDLTTLEVTDAQLAALAGVSTRRIRQLVEAGRLTRVSRNRYALGDAFAALVEDMAGGDKASELTAERVRKLRA
ncbi:TPA: type IV toxin-antitoxin system AbiEi family antitoxin domain-containing protein, partial [Pseudomonas aeruginosa]